MAETPTHEARGRAVKARLAQAFRGVFGTAERRTQDQQIVLDWLSMFCRANESEFDPDARIHAFRSGRREVWIEIQRHLHLSDDALWALYTGAAVRAMPQSLTQEIKEKEDE